MSQKKQNTYTSEQGHQVSRRRIGRLMAEEELKVKTKRQFKATTDSTHNAPPITPNLLDRQFTVDTLCQQYYLYRDERGLAYGR